MKITRFFVRVTLIVLTAALLLTVQASATVSKAATLGGTAQSSPDFKVMKYAGASVSLAASTAEPLGQVTIKARKPPVTAANKWAVVIGIADYAGTDNDLWNPDDDAREMAQVLVANYGFADSHIKILLNRRATAAAILAALDWLVKNENAGSSVMIFYSGHGFRAADSEKWDADTESDGYDEGIVSADLFGLPDGLLKARLAALESSKVALCFGSCHSGGLFDDNDDLQAPGRVIAAACKADQYGWDYSRLGNTLWGKYFVDDGLLLKKADQNGDGASIEEANAYAYSRVVAAQADSQPQISDGYADELIP